ncbi:MAG: UDP-glucose 4-epimerase GalE [Microscillaceae bacterium]|nr:UDP-glucose 4-epimerase GalE [Microscillaceae bacterium]MDW8460631.1 UDP-glucose 4-epimerase GalE [Cytophagales bacterium]
MKKILVTGGAGYIGSHTVIALAEAGYEPILIDNLVKSSKNIVTNLEKYLGRKLAFYQIDCNDKAAMYQVFTQEKEIAGVIHFAAYREVGESAKKPLLYYTNNLNSLAVLLEVMEKQGCPLLVFSSSCTVYGQATQMPVTEQTPMQPAESVYGNSKQISEEMIHDYVRSLSFVTEQTPDFRAIILRYFNPIASHPQADLSMGYPNDLIRMLVATAAGEREKLIVFGNDYPTYDGTCIRDYLHVMDLAEAHVKSLDYLIQQPTHEYWVRTFNIGTGKGNSVLEMIRTFEQATGQSLPYEIGQRRIGDVAEVYANTDQAQKVLGWKAKYDLATSLQHSWQWQLRKQQKGTT